MPLHDWTLVEDGIFHALHTTWMGLIQNSLNEGLLPKGYYALAEQHAGRFITDVLTLHASPEPQGPLPPLPPAGGIAVAEAPPKVQREMVIDQETRARARSLAIRHVSGHRLIALLEISPANKDRAEHVEEFATKAASAINRGVHLLVVDLFPPGTHDPQGIHGAVVQRLRPDDEPYELPPGDLRTLASYAVGPRIRVYLTHLGVGASLTEMPLFLRPDYYVRVPLEGTYQAAYRGMPAFWRDVLEGKGYPDMS
jgi:hypothetical protein